MHIIISFWDWHAPFIVTGLGRSVIYVNRLEIKINDKLILRRSILLWDILPRIIMRMKFHSLLNVLFNIHAKLTLRALDKQEIKICSAHIWTGFSKIYVKKFIQNNIKIIIERSGTHPIFQKNLIKNEMKKKFGLGPLPSQDVLSHEKIKIMEYEFENADIILTSSNQAKNTFPKRLQYKIKVISLGSNFEKIKCSNSRSGVLIVAGPSLRKGLQYLVIDPRLKYTIVMSKSKFRSKLQRKFQNFSNINFLNTMTRQKLKKVYRSHEFFLFPSIEDGFGMVVFEARSQGCKVIVSCHAGVSETLDKSDTLFFDPYVKSDWHKINDFIVNNHNKPINISKDKSWTEYAEQYEQIIKNVS